jgi:hypothetical protein
VYYFTFLLLLLLSLIIFGLATHQITASNCTDSKYDPYNDENGMSDWHLFFYMGVYVFF